jgi:hypothetical protein
MASIPPTSINHDANQFAAGHGKIRRPYVPGKGLHRVGAGVGTHDGGEVLHVAFADTRTELVGSRSTTYSTTVCTSNGETRKAFNIQASATIRSGIWHQSYASLYFAHLL